MLFNQCTSKKLFTAWTWVWLKRRKVFSERARKKCGNASITRVYKVQGGPNFFPTIQIWTWISSLMIIHIFASRPLNKDKNYIFIVFLSSLSPILLDSIKKQAKNASKRLKIGKSAELFPHFSQRCEFFPTPPPQPKTWTLYTRGHDDRVEYDQGCDEEQMDDEVSDAVLFN